MSEEFKLIMATIVGGILIYEGRICICKDGKKSGFVKFMGGLMLFFGFLMLLDLFCVLI